MSNTSTVKAIKFEKTWTHREHGDFDQYFVEMECGHKGQVSVRAGAEGPWVVGDTAEYTLIPGKDKLQDGEPTGEKWPDRIQKVVPQGRGGGSYRSSGGGGQGKWQPADPQIYYVEATAVIQAKDIATAMIEGGHFDQFVKEGQKLSDLVDATITHYARRFHDLMISMHEGRKGDSE